MRLVHGYEMTKKVLLENRGLQLNLTTSSEAFGKPMTPLATVEHIIADVRQRGDDAVRDITKQVDGVVLQDLEIPTADIISARDKVAPEVVDALEIAASRIQNFHERSRPHSWIDSEEGYGESVTSIERAGIYIPGGTARFPSTELMSAIPARVAGVDEIIIATNPSADQGIHPVVLVAAEIAKVDRDYQVGGAQAIAALAYGTETIPKVDIVCGPGGLFTTLAKKLVFGDVGVEGIYGPTETLIIADETANATLCAADLLAQAEHDVLAKPVLITTSDTLASNVAREVQTRADHLDRSATAMTSVTDHGLIAVVESLQDAFALSNEFAPEHVSLMVNDPWNELGNIRHAGAIFLGEFSHEVLGDYVAGPSHVMPTSGTAKFSSGLNVRSFLKFSPVVGLDDKTAMNLSRTAAVLGRAEGFTAHAEAAEIRDELTRG